MIAKIRGCIFEWLFGLWLVSYLLNGFGYTHFELGSLWQGVVILISFLGRYWIASKYNSEDKVEPKI